MQTLMNANLFRLHSNHANLADTEENDFGENLSKSNQEKGILFFLIFYLNFFFKSKHF